MPRDRRDRQRPRPRTGLFNGPRTAVRRAFHVLCFVVFWLAIYSFIPGSFVRPGNTWVAVIRIVVNVVIAIMVRNGRPRAFYATGYLIANSVAELGAIGINFQNMAGPCKYDSRCGDDSTSGRDMNIIYLINIIGFGAIFVINSLLMLVLLFAKDPAPVVNDAEAGVHLAPTTPGYTGLPPASPVPPAATPVFVPPVVVPSAPAPSAPSFTSMATYTKPMDASGSVAPPPPYSVVDDSGPSNSTRAW
nr:hypothetical protein HK105_001115 [Polyrhizophydium stewartii]